MDSLKLLESQILSLLQRPTRLFKKDVYRRIQFYCETTLREIFENFEHPGEAVLYYDISSFGMCNIGTGIQRVVKNIYKHIKITRPDIIVIPVMASQFKIGFYRIRCNDDLEDIEFTGEKIKFRSKDRLLLIDMAIPTYLKQDSMLKQIRDEGGYVWVVVYDLLPIEYPNYFPIGVGSLFREWLLRSSEVANFICDSRTVRRKLKCFLEQNNVNNKSIGYFYPGVDFAKNTLANNKIQDEIVKKIQVKFFLMVSTIEPRKGHWEVLSVFEKLWHEGYKIGLVIVGKKGWLMDDFMKRISNHPKKNKLLFYDHHCSDEILKILYANARATIVASKDEGFGLPIIEANYFGSPVIARDIEIFQEVGEGLNVNFYRDSEELQYHILKLLDRKQNKICCNLSKFSWDSASTEIIKWVDKQYD